MNGNKKMEPPQIQNAQIQFNGNSIILNLGEGVAVTISTMEPLDKAVSYAVAIAKRFKKRPFEMGEIG